MIIKAKGLGTDLIEVQSPMTLGGPKSEEYMKLSGGIGKIPLYLTSNGLPIPESDCIARYMVEKYSQGESFIPASMEMRSLSEQICRCHDIYISPIQVRVECMSV